MAAVKAELKLTQIAFDHRPVVVFCSVTLAVDLGASLILGIAFNLVFIQKHIKLIDKRKLVVRMQELHDGLFTYPSLAFVAWTKYQSFALIYGVFEVIDEALVTKLMQGVDLLEVVYQIHKTNITLLGLTKCHQIVVLLRSQ